MTAHRASQPNRSMVSSASRSGPHLSVEVLAWYPAGTARWEVGLMTDLQLARVYHTIMGGFVRDGRAPHYTDLAFALGVSADHARRLQQDLLALGGPHWAHPGTDLIVGFAPFSNLATPYRVTVDGEQRWYAECGLEALAVSWLFPGREVRIDARCLAIRAPTNPLDYDDHCTAKERELCSKRSLRWRGSTDGEGR